MLHAAYVTSPNKSRREHAGDDGVPQRCLQRNSDHSGGVFAGAVPCKLARRCIGASLARMLTAARREQFWRDGGTATDVEQRDRDQAAADVERPRAGCHIEQHGWDGTATKRPSISRQVSTRMTYYVEYRRVQRLVCRADAALRTAPHRTAPHRIVPDHTAPHHAALHHTAPHTTPHTSTHACSYSCGFWSGDDEDGGLTGQGKLQVPCGRCP